MLKINELKLNSISCQRGDNLLFSNLTYTIKKNDFIQIIGNNGMGKTSLLRIVTGLVSPENGKVTFDNKLISKNREEFNQHLLYIGHHAGVKPELTPIENLRFYQSINESKAGEDILWEALHNVGLLGKEDLASGHLSAGQQKRVALARLWISNAPLWILDEPFNAIDKRGVKHLTRLFEKHCEEGGIAIITSHQDVPSQRLKSIDLANYCRTEELME